MKAKDILKAVVYSNNVEQQGMIEIEPQQFSQCQDIEEWLECFFCEFDAELSLTGGIEFGHTYFYCYDEQLLFPDRGKYPNWENELHLKNGGVVYIYEVED